MVLSLEQIQEKARIETTAFSTPTTNQFVERELLHPAILESLANSFANDLMTFQGGTALRLCYGNPRLSEDLDFAVPSSFSDLKYMNDVLSEDMRSLYGDAVSFKLPSEKTWSPEPGDSIQTARWLAKFDMVPGRRDIPLQKVKIEMANVNSYTRNEVEILHNYEGMKDFPKPTLPVESMEEICADKLLSFSMADYTRWRDLWDLSWISSRPGFDSQAAFDLLGPKIVDYHTVGYPERLAESIGKIPELVHSQEFADQMTRLLRSDVFESTVGNPDYLDEMTNRLQGLHSQALEHVSPSSHHQLDRHLAHAHDAQVQRRDGQDRDTETRRETNGHGDR